MRKTLLMMILILAVFQVTAFAEPETYRADDIFENHGSTMLIIRVSDGQIVGANKAAAAFYGYTSEELMNMNINQINTLTPEEISVEMAAATANQRNYFVFRHRLKDGAIRDVEVYSYPYKNDEGEALLFSIVHDITPKVVAEKKAEMTTDTIYTILALSVVLLITFLAFVSSSRKKSRQDHQQLKSLFDNMNEGFALYEILVDASGKPVDLKMKEVNRVFEQNIGLSRQQLVGKNVSEVIPEYLDAWVEMYGNVAITGVPLRYERYSPLMKMHVSVSCYRAGPKLCATIGMDISEQVLQKEKLEQSKKLLEVILEDTLSGYWDWNLAENTEYLSPSFKAMFGYADDELENSPEAWQRIIYQEDLPLVFEQFRQHKESHGAIPFYNEVRYHHRCGATIWVICSGRIVEWDSEGNPLRMVGCHINITNMKRLENELSTERSLIQTTLFSLGDGVVSTDRLGNIDIMNPVAEKLTGWTHQEAKGLPFEKVFHLVNEFTRDVCPNPIHKVMEQRDVMELASDTILVRKDGTEVPIEDSAAPITGESGHVVGAVMVFRDYTEKKERQREIIYLSYHDQLTGLYNRRFFEEELHRMDTDRNLPFTLAMIDVNGLKLTNDAFGHRAGDELLQRISSILTRECRSDEIIARIGGDEFVILLPKTTHEATDHLVSRIYQAVSAESYMSVVLSVSIGWATKTAVEQNMTDVFKKAEEYMYRKKLTESQSMRNQTIQAILRTLNEKNVREKVHSEKVSVISRRIGEALHMDYETLRELETAGLMHDIGKIAVREDVLNKPGALTPEEYDEIKQHPESSYQILKSVDGYSALAEVVLYHHERWDGSGYPKGLKGEDIPVVARIIAVADAYEAMISDRSYRKAMSSSEAIAELKKHAGTQFDSRIVQCFVDVLALDELE